MVAPCENKTASPSLRNLNQGELPIATFYEFKRTEDGNGTSFSYHVNV
ncbi:MAG: hypothetical protein ACHBN1_33940 [Heteroscytonema crispum UTEX LB 1556]